MVGPQLDLIPGETMILHSHPHWWYFWKQVLAGVGVIVLFLVWASQDGDGAVRTVLWWLVVLGFVVWAANTIYQFVQWQTTRFAITDQRVAFQSGVIRRSGVSIPINRITNVNFDQSIIARMLNNGIVTIESAGETGDSIFENIPDPENVRNVIFKQVDIDKEADSTRDADALAAALRDRLPPPGESGASPKERLEELEALHADGLVSDEEFEQKRQQILGDL
ncbi:MAG: PH domain-containing protein [Actinomycetota bacterium]